jgi:hypothetical protein
MDFADCQMSAAAVTDLGKTKLPFYIQTDKQRLHCFIFALSTTALAVAANLQPGDHHAEATLC